MKRTGDVLFISACGIIDTRKGADLMKLNRQIHHAEAIARLVGIQDRNHVGFQTIFREFTYLSMDLRSSRMELRRLDHCWKLFFSILIDLAEHQVQLTERDIMYIIKLAEKNELEGVFELYKNRKKILVNDLGRAIYPKTFNQKDYVEAIESHDLVLSVGPAGTGKTYLAVAQAVADLKNGKVKN